MNDMYTATYEKLSTLQWLMKRRQMFSQAESGRFADSTRGQGRILAMLKIQPEIATKDLDVYKRQGLFNATNTGGKYYFFEKVLDKCVIIIYVQMNIIYYA